MNIQYRKTEQSWTFSCILIQDTVWHHFPHSVSWPAVLHFHAACVSLGKSRKESKFASLSGNNHKHFEVCCHGLRVFEHMECPRRSILDSANNGSDKVMLTHRWAIPFNHLHTLPVNILTCRSRDFTGRVCKMAVGITAVSERTTVVTIFFFCHVYSLSNDCRNVSCWSTPRPFQYKSSSFQLWPRRHSYSGGRRVPRGGNLADVTWRDETKGSSLHRIRPR